MKTTRWFLIPALSLAAALSGCGDETPAPTDGGTQDVTQPDVITDAAPDGAQPDAAPDATMDAAPDGAQPDARVDAAPDATPDATPDVGPDATPDATPDVGPDAAPDAAPDVGPDAAPDAAPDVPVDMPSADAGAPLMFAATLQGAQEVPAVYDSTASGTATFTLSGDRSRLTYTIMHTLPTVTGAHLHLGLAGESGGVEVPLTAGPSPMTGMVTLTATQATALEEGRLYVNLHTASHAGGEIRGQIVRPGERVWVARLTGAQEVPPVAGDATGLAQVLLADGNESIRYIVRSPVTPTMAHIHTGPGGVSGPVTVDLAGTAMTFSGTRTVAPAAVMTDLFTGRWYVNVHTAAAPMGALRGQLLRPGEVLYTTTLSGANEVPPVTTTASGVLAVILSNDHQRLTYEGSLANITPSAAHLHRGAAGVNGGVDVPLTLVGGNVLRGVGDVPATMPDAFFAALDAGGEYANVHSTANPGGEIRGQLQRR